MESLLLVVLYLSPSWVLLVMYMYGKDAIIENVKGKVMEAVLPSIGGGITDAIPDFTGPAAPLPDAPAKSIIPEGTGLGIPSF